MGDEGGFAPNLATNEDALKLIVEAIEKTDYRPGEDVAIALDPAASEFYTDKKYVFRVRNKSQLRRDDRLVFRLDQQIPDHIHRGRAGGRRLDGWASLTAKLGSNVQLVGDDIFVTNPEF